LSVIDSHTVSAVERIIRDVAGREILPRFGRLTAADITEKAPGDLVTVADRRAEEALSAQLTAIVPGSVVVGEEAVSADAGVMDMLAGPAPVWIVDPIDGTHNFVADNARFTTLVALADRGRLVASWTYAPVLNIMATATAGGGAYVDGRRARVRSAPTDLAHLDVTTPQQKWWNPEQQRQFNALSRHDVAWSFFDTSAFEYIELACGRRTAMVLTWEFPWDHAAGLLLHAEAGGVTTTRDGAPFCLTGGNALPFVCAPTEACAALIHAALAT
jgi:fructose-1,6-bisphosphatase/inositol monophosphatase family enzyme